MKFSEEHRFETTNEDQINHVKINVALPYFGGQMGTF